MTTDEFFAEAKRLNLRMLGTPEETRAALDLKDAEIQRLTELADSEGTRAVNYLRRARKAEKALRELVELEDMPVRMGLIWTVSDLVLHQDLHHLTRAAGAGSRSSCGRCRCCCPSSSRARRSSRR